MLGDILYLNNYKDVDKYIMGSGFIHREALFRHKESQNYIIHRKMNGTEDCGVKHKNPESGSLKSTRFLSHLGAMCHICTCGRCHGYMAGTNVCTDKYRKKMCTEVEV